MSNEMMYVRGRAEVGKASGTTGARTRAREREPRDNFHEEGCDRSGRPKRFRNR